MNLTEAQAIIDNERPRTHRRWLEDIVCFAHEHGRITEGQATRLLETDRLLFREIKSAWKEWDKP